MSLFKEFILTYPQRL
jgi:hypothetical protein